MKAKRTVVIPTDYGKIKVELSTASNGTSGAINFDPEQVTDADRSHPVFGPMFETMTSMILAHACEGVDVESKRYVAGVNETLNSIVWNSCQGIEQ